MGVTKNIAVLPGDGIGKEVIAEAIKVLKTIEEVFGHSFEYEYGLVGAAAIDETGNPYPEHTQKLCKSADAILFGAIGDPKYDNDPSAKVRPEQGLLKMRGDLGLYSNIRPVASYEALYEKSPLKTDRIKGVDLVIFRELTGGIYFGQPRGTSEDGSKAFDTCVYSIEEIERIAHQAFKAAQTRKKKVTLVDKANVIATSRLWRKTVTELAKEYPDVELDFMFVDNAAMKLIQQPSYFDVVLTENLFGDILSDEASVIAGSLGLLPSASVGNQYSLFEPVHGSYPQVAGQNKANPMATILSAAMLLEYAFELHEESTTIKNAVNEALALNKVTEDISSENACTTSEVGSYIAEKIKEQVLASA